MCLVIVSLSHIHVAVKKIHSQSTVLPGACTYCGLSDAIQRPSIFAKPQPWHTYLHLLLRTLFSKDPRGGGSLSSHLWSLAVASVKCLFCDLVASTRCVIAVH